MFSFSYFIGVCVWLCVLEILDISYVNFNI